MQPRAATSLVPACCLNQDRKLSVGCNGTLRVPKPMSNLQEAIATLGAAGKIDDMDLDEAEASEKKSKKSKKKRTAEDAETGQSTSTCSSDSVSKGSKRDALLGGC